MFFFRTVASDRSGINPAVAWIENNDTSAAAFFLLSACCVRYWFLTVLLWRWLATFLITSGQPNRLSAPGGAK